MKKYNINQRQLALRALIPDTRISEIVGSRRLFTIESDIKLCKVFGLKPLSFYNAQMQFRLDINQEKYKKDLNNIIPL
ncbi:MAG: hypothetical protein R3Y43_03070 [Alphaproteobacteria bacterium]